MEDGCIDSAALDFVSCVISISIVIKNSFGASLSQKGSAKMPVDAENCISCHSFENGIITLGHRGAQTGVGRKIERFWRVYSWHFSLNPCITIQFDLIKMWRWDFWENCFLKRRRWSCRWGWATSSACLRFFLQLLLIIEVEWIGSHPNVHNFIKIAKSP